MSLRITCLALLAASAPAAAQPVLEQPAPVLKEPAPVIKEPAPAKPVLKGPAVTQVVPIKPSLRVRLSPLFAKKLNTDKKSLRGFVDLHTHPMSHLGMGGKLLHGAPDTGILMPAGSIWDSRGVGLSGATCNGASRDAGSVEEALGSCYSTHGGHDLIKNKCGNHVRRVVLDEYENGNHANKAHDEDHPPGYPSFSKWPKYDDIEHQQMWVDWVKRAHDGGMRVMVALTVNSMTLAKGLDGNQPYDDKSIGDEQVAQMKRMVAKHKDWMEIAYSAADLRRIVAQDKLAIILGSEVDDIGNFAWSKREPSRGDVKAEIDRLYRAGIRYVFPVHVIDNYFGGTALYEPEFPRATKYHFGQWPKIVCASRADGITWRQTNGWDVLVSLALGEAGGTIPTPTCPDGVGFKNARGLTELGKFALDEMMARGMMIDLDHSSQQTVDDMIRFAAAKPGSYPLASGHNGLRDDARGNPNVTEKSRTTAHYKAIIASKGVAGIGFGNSSASEYILNVRKALGAAPGLAINLGSDINGFTVMPRPEKCEGATCVTYSAQFPKAKMGKREWDYNVDGVAHIGLFPDFLRKVELLGGNDIVDNLFEGAEHVAVMWEHAEQVGGKVKAARPSTFDSIVATVRVTDDDVRDGAQAWLTITLRSGDTAEVEITKLAKGANAANRIEIRLKSAISVGDVAGVKVRHFSNDCFACSRDYWNGTIELEGNAGQTIMKTPVFRIGHETQAFKR
jgi:microsomal dipeptidase-like Zn-dependent dipeptidase